MDVDRSSQLLHRLLFPDDKRFPFSRERIALISRSRSMLDGALFFDLLLSQIAHIEDVSRLYPPRNQTALRALVAAIEEKDELDRLKKASFFYYLLKDFDRAYPGNDTAAQYARRSLIQPNFCSLMDGLYAMDNLDFEAAIHHLTEPSVTAVYPHKVLASILQHGDPRHGPRLALTFVQTTTPVLDTDDSIRAYFSALTRVSVESAFSYQRTTPGHLQAELFRALVDFCLQEKKEVNALKLVNLPFSKEEQVWFEEYVGGLGVPAAQDTLIVRMMHQGMLGEALVAARSATFQVEPEMEGVGWAGLARGLQLGMGPRD